MIYKILNDNGDVINRIVATEAYVQEHYPGHYILEGVEPTHAEPDIVTKLAMIDRFTTLEYMAILNATKNDLQVMAWMDRFSASTTINLDDTRTIDGINMLASKGILLPARATEILTMPARPDEKP